MHQLLFVMNQQELLVGPGMKRNVDFGFIGLKNRAQLCQPCREWNVLQTNEGGETRDTKV
jgi:hypothetical protein